MPALLKFRHRIAILVTLAAVALLTVTGVSLVLGSRSERLVSDVETRYVPLLELNRDLKAQLTAIAGALEDAASAAEASRLQEADELRDQFIGRLTAGRDAIAGNGGDAQGLRADFEAYYTRAREVSVVLMAEEPDEQLATKIEAMRAAQQAVAARLDASTTPDRSRVSAAFESARQGQRTALAVDLLVAVAILVIMLLLSWGIVRRAGQSLDGLSQGMQRLARGDFSEEIRVATRDEFGDVADQANQTARRLREYREQGEREDWIKTGIGNLAGEIAGELATRALGRKVMSYLARYLGAPVAVIYAADESGAFHLVDSHGTAEAPAPPAAFRLGETVLGQAARDDEIRMLADLPGDYLRVRSALGEMAPRHVIIVPFAHEGRAMGVLELGLASALSEAGLELLQRARGALGVAFRVAESQQRTQGLLAETQRQAEELREAYDTLEARNRTLQESEERLQTQEEELRQANEELEGQTEALEAQRSAVVDKNEELMVAQRLLEEKAAELARASRYKSDFLANMSHELRTPLNSIMILSKILAEDGERASDKRVEFAHVIHKSGEELLTLINDVLDLAKIEAGKQELTCEVLPVPEVTAYVQRMFRPLAHDKGLALEVEVAPDAPLELVTDRTRFFQVLKNLLSNAIKFTERGRVAVHVSARAPDHLVIRVADTGIGIPEDKQTWIFEAFAQANSGTSRTYGGTGLGLSIAKQLAALLGGDLTLRSEVGAGSTFQLVLPTHGPSSAPAPTPTDAAPTAAVAPATPPVALDDDRDVITPGAPCLLLIEDDRTFAAIVLRMIREAGFQGLVATTGEDGLDLAQRYRPSGIILDIGLPDIDGWSVMERLKARHVSRDIPVHMLTAGDGATRAKQMGAIGFLTKPVDAEQIRSALHRLEAAAGVPLRKVLLAESDDALRATIGSLLSGSGVQVEAVASAGEAVDRLRADHFGCVVQSLALPDKAGGFELLSHIREHPRTSALPVVVHTRLRLTAEEVQRLEVRDQTTVVLQGERSQERVLEETRLFLHRVRTRMPPAPTTAPRDPERVLEGKSVLVVDDDMRNVYSLSSALRAKHLRVWVAADGVDALDELDRHPDVDLVLMDVMMPRMDGHEAMRRIREQARFEKLPIIALTAKTLPEERQRCLDAGASDFVTKPVDLDRLLALLRVWLS